MTTDETSPTSEPPKVPKRPRSAPRKPAPPTQEEQLAEDMRLIAESAKAVGMKSLRTLAERGLTFLDALGDQSTPDTTKKLPLKRK